MKLVNSKSCDMSELRLVAALLILCCLRLWQREGLPSPLCPCFTLDTGHVGDVAVTDQWARLRDADKFPMEKFMTCSGTDAGISLGCSGLKSSGLHAIGATHA